MDALDGAFNSAEEVATYWLDTSSWQGKHVLYFQATDSDGNVGPVSALYVDNSKPTSKYDCSGNFWAADTAANPQDGDLTRSGSLATESNESEQSSSSSLSSVGALALSAAAGLIFSC